MRILYKHIFLILASLCMYTPTVIADGYKFIFKIKGNTDSTLLLTSYYGEKIRLIDTAFSKSGDGTFIFESHKTLPGGIYMTVSEDKKKLFEFIVSDDQNFTITTDTSDYLQNMNISGSKENSLFLEYLIQNEHYFKKIQELNSDIKQLSNDNKNNDELKAQLKSITDESHEYKLDIINSNKDLFISRLLNSMRDLEVPDSIINSSDSTLAFKYFSNHYFDYLDLSDSCLLRTPIYVRKVKQYFENAVVFNPDSVITAIDRVLELTRPNKETLGYLVWYFISEYQNPKYMGFDKVFVHLVDEYFSKEHISNTTPSILESLQDRANKLRPILIGSPAPQLLMVDTTGKLLSFRQIKSDYTVILFWDLECGICGKEIQEINKIYRKTEFDFEVFAINVNGDLEKWKSAIKEKDVPGLNVNGTRSATEDFHDLYDIYGTPVIYVLDKEKRIIAKRIGADKLIEFFENYEKRNNK